MLSRLELPSSCWVWSFWSGLSINGLIMVVEADWCKYWSFVILLALRLLEEEALGVVRKVDMYCFRVGTV